VSVVEDNDSDDLKMANSRVKPKSINRRRNASSGPDSKNKSLKLKSEASYTASPPTSTQSGAGETEGLPAFAKAKWCTSFLPTLYACLGSSSNPWELYEDGSTFLITLQTILDIVYSKSGYTISVGDKIYSMVCTPALRVYNNKLTVY
jgi:hypothetical protein